MAMVVRIPTLLQKFTKQQSTVQTTGATIQDMLGDLGRHSPGLREQLCDERGALRRFVNLYLNDEDIRRRNTVESWLMTATTETCKCFLAVVCRRLLSA